METTLKITTESPEAATILIEILSELQHAVAKHPVWPIDNVKRVAIVNGECGELVRAANLIDQGNPEGTRENLRDEAIQVAATAIRFIKALDAEKEISIPVFHEQPKAVVGLGYAALFNHDAHRRFSQHNSFALNNER